MFLGVSDFLRRLTQQTIYIFFLNITVLFKDCVVYPNTLASFLQKHKVKISLCDNCGNHFPLKEHIKQDKNNIFVSIKKAIQQKVNIFSYFFFCYKTSIQFVPNERTTTCVAGVHVWDHAFERADEITKCSSKNIRIEHFILTECVFAFCVVFFVREMK